jgi:hypothetical protein
MTLDPAAIDARFPELRTLAVYRLENGRLTEVETYEGDAVVRAEPFEAIELPLAALWQT